ncbi:hypothetical protein LMG33818_001075 [Halomonadaceae bacterium LMG 33818]|uniref:YihY/virulence factor BrkB family protein n=1 Tax=Cernens ardua TaxID=3402176 RepID=UPI003EDC8EAF
MSFPVNKHRIDKVRNTWLFRYGWALYQASNENHTSLIASGIAFYWLMALFPTIAAVITVVAMVSNPFIVLEQFSSFTHFLPSEVATLITTQAEATSHHVTRGLSLTVVVSLCLILFSASRGVRAFVQGLNIIHGYKETRNIVQLTALNVAMTFSMILLTVITLMLVAVLPALFHWFPAIGGFSISSFLYYARWIILLVMASVAIAMLYRYGPNRRKQHWQLHLPGTWGATLVWMLCSAGFSSYVSHFGHYNITYGSLGTVVILLIWLWLSTYIVLLGANLNVLITRTGEYDSQQDINKKPDTHQ